MKTRTLAANLLARTAIIALVAVTAAFFAGCGEKEVEDDDDDEKKTEKKSASRDDDDEFDDEDEYDSKAKDAKTQKKLSTGKKKKTEVTEDEAKALTATVKKDKKSLSGLKGTKKTDMPAEGKESAGKKTADKGDRDYQQGAAAIKAGNPEDAVKSFQAAANKGNSDAMLLLAFCYGEGKGVKKNEDKADRLLEDAADAGNIKAKFLLLFKDIEESEKEPDDRTLKKIDDMGAELRKLAEAGDAEAQALYALSFVTKLSSATSQDDLMEIIEEAKVWSEKAEKNGSIIVRLSKDDDEDDEDDEDDMDW